MVIDTDYKLVRWDEDAEEEKIFNLTIQYNYSSGCQAPREWGHATWPDEGASIEIYNVTCDGKPFQVTYEEKEKILEELLTGHTGG